MKKLVYTVIVVVVLLSAGSCRQSRTGSFLWPSAGERVDSLTHLLDSLIYLRVPTETLDSILGQLRAEVDRSGGAAQLKDRVDFFEAFAMNRKGRGPEAFEAMIRIRERVDSASQPYLYNQIGIITDRRVSSAVGSYDLALSHIDFFSGVGDRFMTAESYQQLGNILKNNGDYDGALSAYGVADSLYRLSGFSQNALFTKINVESLLRHKGDTAAAFRLYRELVTDSTMRSRKNLLALLHYNRAIGLIDREAYDSLKTTGITVDEPIEMYLEGHFAHVDGDLAGAELLLDSALLLARAAGEAEAEAYALYEGSSTLAALGRKAEAYDRLVRAREIDDSLQSLKKAAEILQLETGRQIATRRLERELESSRRVLAWVCVACGCFLLLVLAAWVSTHRIQRLKRQRAEAARERDRVSRELLAAQIAVDESKTLIDSVGREIGGMTDEGRLPDRETRKIVNAIRAHNVQQADRETFAETFTRVHPEFATRLKAINDAITEPDIRLAMMIVTGMDSKRIAATMGIRPESVKQARWRLRSKLSLERGASLEDVLRELTK